MLLLLLLVCQGGEAKLGEKETRNTDFLDVFRDGVTSVEALAAAETAE